MDEEGWFWVCYFTKKKPGSLTSKGHDLYIQWNTILLSHKKNGIMLFVATWMELEINILSEVSQKEKDKYHMISLICGI